MANINIRIDDTLKLQVESILSELGLSMSAATIVFYKQLVRHGGIPFELKVDPSYYADNQAHLKGASRNYESGKSKPSNKTMAEIETMEDERKD